MTNSIFLKGLLVMSAMVPFLAGQTAFAQTVEEITVTARKKSETLQEVPVSISVTSGETIQETGVRDLQTAMDNMPAVQVSRGGGNDNMFIRGVGSGGANGGFEQAVGFVVDGVSIGRSRATRGALVDLEQIEVLKGPQSIYFGPNTSAGVISVKTKSPEIGGELSGYVRASYEVETEEALIEGGVNIPVSDTFALRLAGKYADSEGFVANRTLGNKFPANEDSVLRGSALWVPTDNFSAELKVTYGELDSNSGLDVEIIDCGPSLLTAGCIGANGLPVDDTLNYISDQDLPQFRRLEYVTNSLELKYDIGEMTLTSVTGYYDQTSDNLTDFDIADIPAATAATVSRFGAHQVDNADQISQEIRLESGVDGSLSWMLGGYYAEENAEFNQVALIGFFPAPPFGPGAFQNGIFNDQTATTWSAFGAATYDVTDSFSVTVGVRYVSSEKEIDRTPSAPGPAPASGIAEVDALPRVATEVASRTDTKLLPSIDLQYAASENWNLYGKYSKGFKGAAFSTANSLPGVLTGFIESVDPETVDAFEIGAKGQFADGRIRLNIAAFTSKYKNLQVSTRATPPPGAPPGIYTLIDNAAGSKTQGVELDFSALLGDRFTLSGDVTFMDSKFTDFPDGLCTTLQIAVQGLACTQDLSGRPTLFSPDYSANIVLKYVQPVGNYELTIEPSIYMTDSYFHQSDLDPRMEEDAFEKVNLRVALSPENGDWELAFVGRNLTDELTSNFCADSAGGHPASYACSPDTPATYAIQARYNF